MRLQTDRPVGIFLFVSPTDQRSSNMNRTIDVLVVGAGPTGLTLATRLHRAGVRCRVIDKASGPSSTSKAIGLQYRVSELLAWLGLVDRFEARAQTQTIVNVYGD